MTSLDDVGTLAAADHGLATICVARADGSVHASVVNSGVMPHPLSGDAVIAAVLRGPSWKLRRIRDTRRCTVLFRVGWRWASVDGPVDLIGPDDTVEGFELSDVPGLLRRVFSAAGGTHDDWVEYDRVMAEDGRTAVFLTPERIQSNG